MRLTLRTLLAYLDDTLPPAEAADLGRKLADNPDAQELVTRIRTVTRRRSLTPPSEDANATADYLSDVLTTEATTAFETACLADDGYLAEVAACHQVLTLVLSEQVKVPPTARSRMYALVKGDEAVPNRKPKANLSVATVREADPEDDADAQLLLGMSAYSAQESGGRQLARLGAVLALLLGFGAAAWMATPSSDVNPANRPALVLNAPGVSSPTVTTPAPPPPARPSEPPPATNPEKPPEPAKTATPVAPKPDRIALGQLDRPAGGANSLVVRRTVSGEGWERVAYDPGGVLATDKLVCLPGYKASLKLDSGAVVDLWGSMPELAPSPLLASAVTPALPSDGTHADLIVHVGRIYLSGKQPVKIRLRFADQVWDVMLPDPKSEAVFELVYLPTPGEQEATPLTTARLVTLNGPATVAPAAGEAITLEKSAGLAWTSAAGAKPQLLPPLGRAERDQLARLSAIPPSAQPTLTALTELARRVADGGQVAALLDELVQAIPDSRTTAPAVVAGNRVGIFGLAALGRVDKLADLLASPANPLGRQVAAEALSPALAGDPALNGLVRQVMVEQKKLTPAEADEVSRLLRGLAPDERTDPATVDRLLADLISSALPLRELALGNLIGLVPPEERPRVTVPPFVYDVATPEEDRDANQKAWKRRGEEMKKKMGKT